MISSQADLFKGIIIGFIIGAILMFLVAKGVIPVFNVCPVVA